MAESPGDGCFLPVLPGNIDIELGNLPDPDAEELLRRAGVSDQARRRINRLARGHPWLW